jgi:hypothetical protein
MQVVEKYIPSGAKAKFPFCPFSSAAKAAPFQNGEITRSEEFFRSLVNPRGNLSKIDKVAGP